MEKDLTHRDGQRILRYLLGLSNTIARLKYGVGYTICNEYVIVTRSGDTISGI